MSKTQEVQEDYAIQQLTGFNHAWHGFDIESLLDSMGLYQDEWENIRSSCAFLSPKLIEQIELYFSHVDEAEDDTN